MINMNGREMSKSFSSAMSSKFSFIISFVIFFIFFSTYLISNFFFVSAQQNLPPAEIYSLTYEPSKPVVLEEMKFSVGVRNNEREIRGYKMEFEIIKEGIVKTTEEFTFTLRPGAGTTISPTYIPNDINDFDLIVRLYELSSNKLLDVETLKFNVVSEIGPFDLDISVPSKFVKANSIAPVILTLANMGEKGTDVNVEIVLTCLNQSNIRNSFFIFLPAKSQQNKITSVTTCNEEGQHEISASVKLFNRTWISSSNQFILNKTYTEILSDLPQLISVVPGESKIFDVQIKNTGKTKLFNLKMLVSILPPEWVKISPEFIAEVNPGDLSVFLLNITAPRDAESKEFTVGVTAASDEVLTRKETTLKIASLTGQTVKTGVASSQKPLPTFFVANFLANNSLTIVMAVIAIVAVFVALKIRSGREGRYPRSDALRKIRDTIR